MTIDTHTLALSAGPVKLDPKSATFKLDEAYSPYAAFTLAASLPSAADRQLLDIRTSPVRLVGTFSQDFGTLWTLAELTADVGGSAAATTAMFGGSAAAITRHYSEPFNSYGVRSGTTRNLNLLITERVFDHKANELRLIARSDEAQLHTDVLTDRAPWRPPGGTMRAIANRVLSRYGAALQAGAADGPVVEAAATWLPGVSADAYLTPLLEAVNLRLWCDENGFWYLSEPQPVVAGSLVLTPLVGITDSSDTMGVEGDWYDAVVLVYTWTDEFGLTQTVYDTAGASPSRSSLTRTYNTPYPGPGAAALMLDRARGRGRVLGTTAVSDYAARPGIPTLITPPGTDSQSGYVASVEWAFPLAEMVVTTRGLVDTPPTAWLFAAPGLRWIDIPTGTTWNNYTGV